jgi:hypothetical protein
LETWKEEFEDTNRIIRIEIEEGQTRQWPKEKGQTTIVNGLTPLTGIISAHATRKLGSSALCITNDLPATTTYL